MKNSLFLFILLLLGCLPPLSAQHECVLFSAPGGCYDSTFTLTLSCIDPSHHIRYTINGNTPTVESPLYEAPMMLDERLYSHADIYKTTISPPDLVYVPDSVRHAIVIRAAVFSENDQRLSETFTNTYLIHSLGFDERNLPVVSICADSLDLFDSINGIFVPGVLWNPNDSDHTGNYYQHGIEWERQINVEYYEPSSSEGINQICGLRTHGNLSRRHPAKGMKIYARDIYGKKRFQHTFFPNSHMNSFKRLVLKPFAVFYPYTGTQDYFCNTLAFQVGVDAPLCRPVILFLNGEYWGVYFIQEKIDEHFLEDHHGIDVEKCNIIDSWGGNAEQGNNLNFYHMMVWFQNTDLSDDAAYNYACSIIDMNNFIDYYILQTFIGNWDWPGNNMRCWQEGNGPWRWIFFDGDATLMGYSFDVFENAAVYTPPTTWINFPEAKLLFGKLLENNQFKKRFKERARERESILTIGTCISATRRGRPSRFRSAMWRRIPGYPARMSVMCGPVSITPSGPGMPMSRESTGVRARMVITI